MIIVDTITFRLLKITVRIFGNGMLSVLSAAISLTGSQLERRFLAWS